MSSKMIDIFNLNVSQGINKYDDFYKTWFGDPDFTPESTILESEDVDCGALCNELEFARLNATTAVENMQLANCSGDELDVFVDTFVDLPRRGYLYESDANYKARFKFLVTAKTNYRKLTRWSILNSISYFVVDPDTVQVIELFDIATQYFQVRFEGEAVFDETLFMDNSLDWGYLDQNFLAGIGIGAVQTFITYLMQRIKAAGVDVDVIFIDQNRLTKLADTIIGSVRKDKLLDSWVMRVESFTKLSDATIV